MSSEQLIDMGYRYSGEVFINTTFSAALKIVDRRQAELEKEGYTVQVTQTESLGGWIRGFAIWFR